MADDDEKGQSKPKTRVLLADKLGAFVSTSLKQNGCELMADPSLKDDALRDALKKFQPHILVVRSTKVKKDHLHASDNLNLIIRAGAGYNTIDVAEASNIGIYVANCPGKNAIAVAELAMGHLINLDRRIADNVVQLREGKWNKKGLGKARGLYSRTIAVLGIGNIGKEVCSRALAFGMTVNAYSRSLTKADAAKLGVTYCSSIAEACTDADALSIHLPCTAQTKHIINKDILSKLKDGALVVNTARDGVLNEQDMLLMIKQKNLRYAPDVYDNEPAATDKEFTNKEFSTNPNVYGSHHIGASTDQAEESVAEEVVRIVTTFKGSGMVRNCVNLERESHAKYAMSVRHKDVVGVLAGVLRSLKEDNVNIQEMSNIVFSGSAAACCTLQIDSAPSSGAIEKIKAMPEVYGIEMNKK